MKRTFTLAPVAVNKKNPNKPIPRLVEVLCLCNTASEPIHDCMISLRRSSYSYFNTGEFDCECSVCRAPYFYNHTNYFG